MRFFRKGICLKRLRPFMWHKGYLCCVGNQDCIYLNFQTRGIGAMCAFTKSGKEKSRKRFAHGRDMRSSATDNPLSDNTPVLYHFLKTSARGLSELRTLNFSSAHFCSMSHRYRESSVVYCGQKKNCHMELKIPDLSDDPVRKKVILFLASVYATRT